MYNYFQSDTPTSLWLASLCEQTNVSFLRNSLEPLNATVHNKAGWCSSSDYDEYDYNGVCDAGIVDIGENTYIVSAMTSLPDAEDNYALAENLICALFEARNELAQSLLFALLSPTRIAAIHVFTKASLQEVH